MTTRVQILDENVCISHSPSLLHKKGVEEGATHFPGLFLFILVTHLIKMNVERRGIKYYFLSLWYDSTWNRTSVFRSICECSNHMANGPVPNWLMGKVFANGPGHQGSNPGRALLKTQKSWCLLANIQSYKVLVKDKVEQSRERRSIISVSYTSLLSIVR